MAGSRTHFSGSRRSNACFHVRAFMTAHNLPDVTVVADAGMVSDANQKAIEDAGPVKDQVELAKLDLAIAGMPRTFASRLDRLPERLGQALQHRDGIHCRLSAWRSIASSSGSAPISRTSCAQRQAAAILAAHWSASSRDGT
jgi:hypothetical protein